MPINCKENLKKLDTEVMSCGKCADMVSYRKQPVPGTGAANARIIIVGDYPRKDGAEIEGIPFTNDSSGLLIRKMIEESSLSLEKDIYLTYLVKCTPRRALSKNGKKMIIPSRSNKTHKINCINYLSEEISIMTPHLMISLGLETSNMILKHFFSYEKNVKSMEDIHMKLFENPSFKLVPFYKPQDVTINKKFSFEKYVEDFRNLSKLFKIV